LFLSFFRQLWPEVLVSLACYEKQSERLLTNCCFRRIVATASVELSAETLRSGFMFLFFMIFSFLFRQPHLQFSFH